MSYWAERIAKENDALLTTEEKAIAKELGVEYTKCAKKTKRQLLDLWDEIQDATEDGTLLISDLYKFNRFYDLQNELNKQLTALGQKEISITESRLIEMYEANDKLLEHQYAFNVAYNQEAARKTIERIWCGDGKHWSQRIWGDKSKLQERITSGIVDCVARGTSRKQLVQQLQNDFGVSYNNANRIARTELSYVQNQSTMDKYQAAGVEYYEFLATHDDRTCDVCGELSGQRFRLSDAQVGSNYPPIHPNCRSTVLAVIN